MPVHRRRGAWIAAFLVVVAAALLVVAATCAPQPPDAPAPDVASPGTEPVGDVRAPRARAQRPRTATETPLSPPAAASAAPSVVPTLVLQAAAASPTATPVVPPGRVRVTVRCDGRPVPGVDVWLRSGAPLWTSAHPEWSDGAYFGPPLYLGLAPEAEPVSGSDALRKQWGGPAGRTGDDGVAECDAAPDVPYVVRVASSADRLFVREHPRVTVGAGAVVDVVLDVRHAARITGRCLDADGRPVTGAWVQARTADGARPASGVVRTAPTGEFTLEVDGADASYVVRVAAPRAYRLSDDDTDLPSIVADATLTDVVPGDASLDVRLGRERHVLLDVTAEVPFAHLQVEGLVFDATANAWGRLGGPVFTRVLNETTADARRAVAAVPRPDAERPLCVWSWGNPPMLNAVDPRGRERAAVRLERGRRTSVTGAGWLATDRVRVVCFVGPGGDLPVIWVEEAPGPGGTWSRADTPPCKVEFRLVRDGCEIGTRPTVPASRDDAPAVRIDLDR